MPVGPAPSTSGNTAAGAVTLGGSRVTILTSATDAGYEYIPYTESAFRILNVNDDITIADSSPIIIRCDTTTNGAFTVTLPKSSDAFGGLYHVVKVDSNANSVTIAVDTSDTWFGATAAKTLATQYKSVTLIAVFDSDESISGWHVIATT